MEMRDRPNDRGAMVVLQVDGGECQNSRVKRKNSRIERHLHSFASSVQSEESTAN
jgi:hypothetical protein